MKNDQARMARNIAAIALVALAITLLPRGGDAVAVAFAAAWVASLAAMAAAGGRLYREQSFFVESLPDPDRALLYGSVVIAVCLLAAGGRFDQFAAGGLVRVLLLSACAGGLYVVWQRSRRNLA